MDQIDTDNGQLILSTENAGTLTTAIKILQDQNTEFLGGIKVNGPASYNTIKSANEYTLGFNDSNNVNQWWIKTYTNGAFTLHENGVGDKFTILAGGNVGIGTTTPSAKLQVTDGELLQGNTADGQPVTGRVLRLSGQGVYGGSSSGPYGQYGSMIFNASTNYTGGAKRFMITNGYLGNSLAFIRSTDANTDPALAGDNGTISSGSVSYYIASTGSNIFPESVGIGTTTPDGKLEVAGGTTLGFRLSNAGDSSAYDQVRMTYGGYNSGAPTVTLMPLTTPGSGNVDTTFHFMNSNGLNADNNRANVNIDGILYVGSGRQSGETTLIMRNYDDSLVNAQDIQNSIRMSGRYWSGSASQLVETRINSVHQESNGNGGSALTFMTQTGGSAVTEKMRIDKNGNVGIGYTSPGSKLSVNGDGGFVSNSSSRVLYLTQNATDAGNIIQFLDQSGNNVWELVGRNSNFYIYNNQNSVGYVLESNSSNGHVAILKGGTNASYPLDVTGTIRSTADVIAYSDRRVKENIKTIDNALDKVIKLRGVSYNRKDIDDKSTKIGVIAQEVKEILPEVVENDLEDKYSVAYGNMAGLFIEAIKELKAEIEELKKHSCDCKK